MTTTERKHSHYFKDVAHLKEVDIYRILRLYGVTDPNIAHAVKKLLVAGGRGAGKNIEQDVHESIDSLNRYLEMQAEDCNVGNDTTKPEITDSMVRLVAGATSCSVRKVRTTLEQKNGDIMAAVLSLTAEE